MSKPPKVSSAKALAPLLLEVTFDNGEIKTFDVARVLKRPGHEVLSNFAVLKNVKVEHGGYAICWNDEVDICENELWVYGNLKDSSEIRDATA
jgi:hypothetical protein